MTAQIQLQDQATRTTDPAARAQQVLRERADQLRGELETKVELATLLLAPPARAQAHEGLLGFCTHRLVPDLPAIDQTV